MKEENLIFIISQPRAGSTYLQNLLSNNIQTNTCSEPWILLNFANQIKPELFETKFDNKLTKGAFNNYLEKYKIDFKAAQKKFLLNLYFPMQNGFEFVIDKTPRYWEIVEEISELFPKSKIIILKRNPIDVAKSIIKTWNIKDLETLSYYKRDLLLAPKRLNKFSVKERSNTYVYSLKYEDLIVNTSKEVEKLYKWIGLNYTDAILDVSNNIKYKGEYGDPYQNSEFNDTLENEVSKNKVLTKTFISFIEGYSSFLGTTFLKEYGNYNTASNASKNTKEFSYFIHLGSKKGRGGDLKNEIKYIIKEFYFRHF